ncbi:hypothetical protein [Campylobacter hyointestinalis]|uniref:hypothetical protein n=1 Tax=Campylobacter hyointestinalis TaxID=198 RepID=UPI000DCE4A35|nr:hypothetical protein [Campylobacter hyointestinalis]RAZ52644.1 hypothetical protein CHL10075_01630 [Campylobacter hyointestinalis subsp. lawsonii]
MLFSGCDGLNSAKCPTVNSLANRNKNFLELTAKDNITIKNMIMNRGNCFYRIGEGQTVLDGYFINGVNKVISMWAHVNIVLINNIKVS